MTADQFNALTRGFLPAQLGIEVAHVGVAEIVCEMRVTQAVMAPNGYLHAGSIVTLADTAAGYGCMATLPDGAKGFTTIELKSNHLGTARSGSVRCLARAVHLGKNTQVWDAVVTHAQSNRTIALFRCTQMILKTPGNPEDTSHRS